MFFISLFRWVRGYVAFHANKGFPERFLNLCAAAGVSVWGIGRSGDNMTGCMPVKSYKQIRALARKAGVLVKIDEKNGLPFYIKKYQFRGGFIVGIGLFAGLLYLMSSYVWTIQVEGNERISSRDILGTLESLGFYEGMKSSKADVNTLKQELILEIPDIAWAAINIEGCTAVVEVHEKLDPGTGSDQEEKPPSNLVASADGRITRIQVYTGETTVQIGDAVAQGDLLATGTIEHVNGQTSFVQSIGKVFAETERDVEVFCPFEEITQVRTGKVEKKHVLTIFGWNIPFYLGSTKWEYERETDLWRFTVDGAALPLKRTTGIFYETTEETRILTEEEAVDKARKLINLKRIVELKDATVLSQSEKIEVTDEGIIMNVHYKCEENIANQEIILINE